MKETWMNFGRDELIKGLKKCTIEEIIMFKRMYGKVEWLIEDVIEKMPDDKISWAMEQVERTLKNKL